MKSSTERNCSGLDHIYPSRKRTGTPCHCGANTWGSENPRKRKTSSTIVLVEKPSSFTDPDPVAAVLHGAKPDNQIEQPDAPEKNSDAREKPLASESTSDVASLQNSETDTEAVSTQPGEKAMSVTLNFTKLSKSGKYALYRGLRTITRLSVSDFPNEKPVQSFTVEGDFAGARVVMTAEERKAARKAAPKLTLAQQLEKKRAAVAKFEAKVAKAAAAEGAAV